MNQGGRKVAGEERAARQGRPDDGAPAKVGHFFLDFVDSVPTLEGKIAVLFEGFFRNRMQHVVNLLMNPGLKVAPDYLVRRVQDLEDFYHHFCPRDTYHERLYWELIEIVRDYPNMTVARGHHGLQFLEEIFEIYGFKLDLLKRDLRASAATCRARMAS